MFFKRSSKKSPPPMDLSELASPTIERRYRSDVPYLLPKDLGEGDRLNFQHYALRQALKGNYVAPLGKDIQQILDVGSGTGIWGHEIAHQFPQARIFGLDIESPQTVTLTAKAVPPPMNYHFLQGDILAGLPFPEPVFDFTHQRLLIFAIPAEKWPFVISELVRVTRSGGWIELIELEGFYNMGPVMEQANSWLKQSLQFRGIQMNVTAHLDTMLQQQARNQGVQIKHIKKQWLDVPIGQWKHERIGLLVEKDIYTIFSALKPIICAQLKIEPSVYDNVLQRLVPEWNRYKAHLRCCIVSAQVMQ